MLVYGDIEWLHDSDHGEVEKGEDFGYEKFMNTIEALVMRQNTYEKTLFRQRMTVR